MCYTDQMSNPREESEAAITAAQSVLDTYQAKVAARLADRAAAEQARLEREAMRARSESLRLLRDAHDEEKRRLREAAITAKLERNLNKAKFMLEYHLAMGEPDKMQAVRNKYRDIM